MNRIDEPVDHDFIFKKTFVIPFPLGAAALILGNTGLKDY